MGIWPGQGPGLSILAGGGCSRAAIAGGRSAAPGGRGRIWQDGVARLV